MRKSSSIRNLVILAVLAIFLMQGLWLRKGYITSKQLMQNEIKEILVQAINKETFQRKKTYEEERKSKHNISSIIIDFSQEEIEELHSPIDISLQEILAQDSCFISLMNVHDICSKKLKREDIQGTFIIQRIDMENDSLLESTISQREPSEASFTTRSIPIRTHKKEGIRLLFLRPHWSIFRQMFFLLILSAILMGFVFFALYKQLNLFLKEKKLRKLQKDHTEAMVHTMKTPLQSITQVFEFIDKGSFDHDIPKRSLFIGLAGKQIKGLLAMVNRILAISQWEDSTLKLYKKSIDIKVLIFTLCEQAKETTNKEITLITNFNLDRDKFLLDKDGISDTIQNLLENAIKYSYDAVTIIVDVYTKQDILVIKIKDNGLGISTKAQKNIFKKFERGDAPFRQGAKGFGLGLAFVKGIVEAHGGTIKVESQEEKGAEFCIRIPVE